MKEYQNICLICFDNIIDNVVISKTKSCTCKLYFHEACYSLIETVWDCLICRTKKTNYSIQTETSENQDTDVYSSEERVRAIDEIDFSHLLYNRKVSISAVDKDTINFDVADLYENLEPKGLFNSSRIHS